LWTGTTGDIVEGSPSVANGMVYVESYDRNVYAYALDAGNNAAYKHGKTQPPSFSTLHPDRGLKAS
jgi:outer membrane protein assembly factor BamB